MDAQSYLWDFGDGTTSIETSPIHSYTKNGKFTVKLTGKNGKKESSVSQDITITSAIENATITYLFAKHNDTKSGSGSNYWDVEDPNTFSSVYADVYFVIKNAAGTVVYTSAIQTNSNYSTSLSLTAGFFKIARADWDANYTMEVRDDDA